MSSQFGGFTDLNRQTSHVLPEWIFFLFPFFTYLFICVTQHMLHFSTVKFSNRQSDCIPLINWFSVQLWMEQNWNAVQKLEENKQKINRSTTPIGKISEKCWFFSCFDWTDDYFEKYCYKSQWTKRRDYLAFLSIRKKRNILYRKDETRCEGVTHETCILNSCWKLK